MMFTNESGYIHPSYGDETTEPQNGSAPPKMYPGPPATNPLMPTTAETKRYKGMDIRFPTTFLDSPKYLKLSAEALTCLLVLQAYSFKANQDGWVEREAYEVSERWRGLPWVTDSALRELAEAGLIVRGVGGIWVSWIGQSTFVELEEQRAKNRERQQRRRDRQKNATDSKPARTKEASNVTRDDFVSNAVVTPLSRKTNADVGEERTRTGSKEEDVLSPWDASAMDVEYPPPPPKEFDKPQFT